MKKHSYTLTAKVFLWSGDMASWHFIGVPNATSQEIKTTFGANHRGFGSLPVTVTIGNTTWDTSIFPDSRSGTYLLPLKAAVRKKEDIEANDTITFTLKLRV